LSERISFEHLIATVILNSEENFKIRIQESVCVRVAVKQIKEFHKKTENFETSLKRRIKRELHHQNEKRT